MPPGRWTRGQPRHEPRILWTGQSFGRTRAMKPIRMTRPPTAPPKSGRATKGAGDPSRPRPGAGAGPGSRVRSGQRALELRARRTCVSHPMGRAPSWRRGFRPRRFRRLGAGAGGDPLARLPDDAPTLPRTAVGASHAWPWARLLSSPAFPGVGAGRRRSATERATQRRRRVPMCRGDRRAVRRTTMGACAMAIQAGGPPAPGGRTVEVTRRRGARQRGVVGVMRGPNSRR